MDDLLKCPALHQPGLETNLRQRPDAKACLALVALFALLLGSVALAQTASFQTPPAGSPSGMDQAIALITEALVRFQNVQDYECRLMKRERVKDELLPESAMTMRVRNKPFSVYLRSELPEADRGLAVCYVESRNRGMMRVHPAGMLGVLGFWSVSPHDPRAFEKNRHCITDAGLGNLLVNTARYWDMERRLNQTLVRITDDELCGHACTRIETIHPDRNAGAFYGYRCYLWLDKATHMPVGAETYDWPRFGRSPDGDLLESYRYLNLRCNLGLGDDAFPD